MLFSPNSYTTVFLSYDEPNCDKNYQHLLTLCPSALRVHGVKGSDTAHKCVAALSLTGNVIVVDGDNFVKPDFYTKSFELPESYNQQTNVLSFSSYNTINGNCYGNGGIKVWPVSLLKSMKTHENGTGVDFDLSLYTELDVVGSEIRFASNFQAWRAGFREGIKLLLDNEKPVSLDNMDYRNFDRLWMWTHVGADVTYGLSAIHGARQAVFCMLSENFNYKQIIDFDNFNVLYNDNVEDSNRLFNLLRIKTDNWLFGDVLSVDDSETVKFYNIVPKRKEHNIDDEFQAWAFNVRRATKLNDTNELNKICSMGRSELYGRYKIDGAIYGKEHRERYKHNYQMLGKIYDYNWLRETYDRLYKNTV